MTNPFPDNPVFEQFLGIKHYFRQYTTRETVQRTKKLIKIAREMKKDGVEIAFDILGSMNFGMAEEQSDFDMIMYVRCNHKEEVRAGNPQIIKYKQIVFDLLENEMSFHNVSVDIVDCINLKKLKFVIGNHDFEDPIVARFVFYRTICRGINKKFIRSYEKAIMNNKELFEKIEETLTYSLIEFTKTSTHADSMYKYIQRLKNADIKVPSSIYKKINSYLESSAK